MTMPRRVPFVRHLLLAAVLVPLVPPLVSCGPSAGDCTTEPGDDGGVSAVSCSDPSAQRVVLRRADITQGGCSDVPGTVEQVPVDPASGYENPYVLCVGRRDGPPPERAPDTARPGDCLTDVGVEPVQRTPCSTPGAYRVLTRNPYLGVVGYDACSEVPGSTVTYDRRVQDTAAPGLVISTYGSVYFCLNPAELDASRSPEVAKPGDCMRTLPPGRGQDVEIVACSDPRANRRVVLRSDLRSALPDTACEPAPGTTPTVVSRDQGLHGSVLCLAPVRPGGR